MSRYSRNVVLMLTSYIRVQVHPRVVEWMRIHGGIPGETVDIGSDEDPELWALVEDPWDM